MRKEYNDRHNAPLVNPAITHGEYEAQKAKSETREAKDAAPIQTKPRSLFIPTMDGIEAKVS